MKRNVLPEIGTSDPVASSRQEKVLIAVVLAVAVLSRSAALWIFSDTVADDRDAYLAIARTLLRVLDLPQPMWSIRLRIDPRYIRYS